MKRHSFINGLIGVGLVLLVLGPNSNYADYRDTWQQPEKGILPLNWHAKSAPPVKSMPMRSMRNASTPSKNKAAGKDSTTL